MKDDKGLTNFLIDCRIILKQSKSYDFYFILFELIHLV